MKTISLWQPWAAGIASGFKKVETRSWATSYRGMIAIHASKKWNSELRTQAQQLLGYNKELIFGAVICLAKLTDCKIMTEDLINKQSDLEKSWGDWRNGRYAWFLEEIKVLDKPFKARGRQRLFNVDLE